MTITDITDGSRVVIASRVDREDMIVQAGGVLLECSVCNVLLWTEKKSRDLIKNGAILLCVSCGKKLAKLHEMKFLNPESQSLAAVDFKA